MDGAPRISNRVKLGLKRRRGCQKAEDAHPTNSDFYNFGIYRSSVIFCAKEEKGGTTHQLGIDLSGPGSTTDSLKVFVV